MSAFPGARAEPTDNKQGSIPSSSTPTRALTQVTRTYSMKALLTGKNTFSPFIQGKHSVSRANRPNVPTSPLSPFTLITLLPKASGAHGRNDVPEQQRDKLYIPDTKTDWPWTRSINLLEDEVTTESLTAPSQRCLGSCTPPTGAGTIRMCYLNSQMLIDRLIALIVPWP